MGIIKRGLMAAMNHIGTGGIGIPVGLKVFHFIGARRKRHFMYKLAKEKDGYLRFYHLTKDDSCYDPRSQDMADVEIVQSENWEKL